jgi:hypothetical protein
MRFGQSSSSLLAIPGFSNLEDEITSKAKAAAEAYAYGLYDQYRNEIWLTGIAIGFWILWVSTRSTCKCK